tara:strand:- start:2408 stop:3925 length:1518 start_codon:yes stop_codon:yes gene_type:complete
MYIGKQLIRGQNNIIDDISSGFNGSTTAFSLTASGDAVSPATVNQMFVSLGGVLQKPGTDFTLSSSTITFTTAPTSGLSFWCLVQGDSVDLNAPSDGSVTPSKISANGDFAFPADIRLKDSDGSHYVGLQAPATVGSNVVWTLPAADGTANYVLKTDGSGNLGWAADSSTDSTKMPLAGGSFTGDVVFTGDAANVTWDKSTDDLIFNDNAKAAFGTGSDLQIYHDGSDSRIQNTTGNLLVRNEGGGDVYLRVNATESAVDCIHNGAVNLYHDNTKRIETTATGGTITGNLTAVDGTFFKASGQAQVVIGSGDASGVTLVLDGDSNGDSSGSDYSYIQHDTAGDLYIVVDNPAANGSIYLKSNGGTYQAVSCRNTGVVELRYQNTAKLETSAAGVTVTGTVSDSKGELRTIVQNTQAGAYTLVAADAGKHILASGTVTVPNSTFSAGDAITIVNNTASNLTITKSITTMYNAADGTSANRTLATRGMATILFASGTVAYISGAGLS